MPFVELNSVNAITQPTPVRVPLDPQTKSSIAGWGQVALDAQEGSAAIPAQADGDGLVFLASDLPAASSRRYKMVEGAAAKGVSLREGPDTLGLELPQGLFGDYYFGAGLVRPFLWPVNGPGQKCVTRDFPMVERPGDGTDHEHHRSLWTAYEEVNDSCNWHEREGHGFMHHRGFTARQQGPVFGGFTSQTLWSDKSGAPVMDEVRSLRLYNAGEEIRLLDYDVTLRASYGDVTFGDTKEAGILSVRVAPSMEGANGGLIVNSNGGRGEEACWGKQAAWCHYSGEVGGETYGIGIFDRPSNTNFPTRWHVRDYGLFATNPFSTACFDAGEATPYLMARGQELTFHYRLAIHQGDAEQGGIADLYRDYIEPPMANLSVGSG